MRTLRLPSFSFAGCLLLAATASAHGGQYRGPGNTTPPTSTGSTNGNAYRGAGDVTSSGGAAAPAGPTGQSGGGAGKVIAPTPGAPQASPRGFPVGDDLGRWEFWWEFGKDPFLRLRDAIYDARRSDPGQALWDPRAAASALVVERPDANDLRRVAGELQAALSSTDDRDVASACLIALAKIGPQRAGFDLGPHLRPFLQGGDQELRETAALAHGIAGEVDAATVDLLSGLVADDEAGRRASGGVPVNERTRAFAAFGMGLLLARSRDAAASMRLVRALQAVVDAPERHGRNLVVASIEALARFPAGWQGAAAATLRDVVVGTLGRYYERDLGAGDELVQAHVPTAIAGLVVPDSPAGERWRARFAHDLAAGLPDAAGRSAKVNPHVAQSCALALGTLTPAWDDRDSVGATVGRLLVQVHAEHKDEQTRSFATLALARLGGAEARQSLLGMLEQANKGVDKPWVAVALGVLVARERERSGAGADPRNAEVVEALRREFRAARNPSSVGAIAIAIGLTGARDEQDMLRASLMENRKRDDVAGYVALGLGLLQDRRAVPDLRSVRRDATRRPFLLLQSVRALGLIGDHEVAAELSAELADPDQSLVRLSATSSALGQIGDRRCLPALEALLQSSTVTPLTRAFAAVALGLVCDKDPLPWNSAYASHGNYRASTETLTDGMAGILDLL